jgi:hypothetical protein
MGILSIALKQREANNAHGSWWVYAFIITFSVPRWLGKINFVISMNYRNRNSLRVLQCRKYICVGLGIPFCPSCLCQDEIATKSDVITLYAGSACFVYIVRQKRMRLLRKNYQCRSGAERHVEDGAASAMMANTSV